MFFSSCDVSYFDSKYIQNLFLCLQLLGGERQRERLFFCISILPFFSFIVSRSFKFYLLPFSEGIPLSTANSNLLMYRKVKSQIYSNNLYSHHLKR